MSHLTDKGMRSKRFRTLAVLVLIVTLDYKVGSGVSSDVWIDFLKWAYGIWTVSEVGKAGFEAYRDKGAKNE